jgi:ADP-heptose:LPS heptosyltransferase
LDHQTINICNQKLKKAKPFPYDFLQRRYNKVLFISADNIGDSVMRNFMIEYLRKHLIIEKLIVVCQKMCRDVFFNNKYVDEIFIYDRKIKLIDNQEYADKLIDDIRGLNADLVINPRPFDNSVDDVIALANSNSIVVGFSSLKRNLTELQTIIQDEFYSRIVPYPEEDVSCMEINRYFLESLLPNVIIFPESYIPLSDKDIAWAELFFKTNNLNPQKSIAVFAGVATSRHKEYFNYGKALELAFKDENITVIILGSTGDVDINTKNFKSIPFKKVDLTGKTTLLQSAAIISMVPLAFGADCGLTHIATALKTPTVTLLGNPHLGITLPYSNLMTSVIIPLSCKVCHWQCMYREPFCITKVTPEAIATALKEAWSNNPDKMRIYLQSQNVWDSKNANEPCWDYSIAENRIKKATKMLPYELEITMSF